MALIRVVEIDSYPVKLLKQDISVLNTPTMFNGEKLLHPLVTKLVTTQVTKSGKHGKPFVQTNTSMFYLPDFVPGALEDLQEAERFDMKHDGSCGYLLRDETEGKFIPYARFDVRKQKDGFPDVPKDGIPCEPMPTNPDATHWPHFVPCASKPNDYKWYLHAFKLAEQSGKLDHLKQSFTVEYMGKKFNYKPCDGVEQDATIVPHGLVTLEIPKELRTYEGFKKILKAFPFMEGIIVRGKNHIWKMRREMFHDEHDELKWPSESVEKISEQVMFV